jgi:hypothetical protein
MKKIIVAISVFAFVFALGGDSLKAMVGDSGQYTASINNDKDPKADGTKKADKADKKSSSSCAASCSDKSAKASGECTPGDKAAKTSTETGSKKVTTADAIPAPQSK